MNNYIMAYDLGTGGIKASLYREDGVQTGRAFIEYSTAYPKPGWHEQRPEDWWQGVCQSTAKLLAESDVPARSIVAVGLSGQSLVAAPLDRDGHLLLDRVPIWSDARATAEAGEFFATVPYEQWYLDDRQRRPARDLLRNEVAMAAQAPPRHLGADGEGDWQ